MAIVAPGFSLANQPLVKKPIYLITITGYGTIFTNVDTGVGGQQPWITEIDDLTLQVNELDGGADMGQLIFTVLDFGAAITAAFPSFIFEGKKVTLKSGFVGMLQADFALLFTGVVDLVESADQNNSYKFTCVDANQKLSNIIYQVADDGFATDDAHRKTVAGHPLDILLDILENQLGYAPGDIDLAAIATYKAVYFNDIRFKFSLDTAPAAKDFIEQQLMKPLGGYIWVKNTGAISVNFFYPYIPFTLNVDKDDIVDIPEAGQIDLSNVVTTRFDKSHDSKYLAEAVSEYDLSISQYGQFGQLIIESDGSRSAYQGFLNARLTAQQIFRRYGLKKLKFDSITCLWTSCLMDPGDFVKITHANVPDRLAGVMGVTAKQFIITARTWHFQDCTVEYQLLDAAYLNYISYHYVSDAFFPIPDFPAASGLQQGHYMFLCNDAGLYSDASAGNTVA